MAITLVYSTTTVVLDPDLEWIDENSWHPVEQAVQRTVTGGLIVSSAQRTAGRPITLQPTDQSSAWMSRATLDTLKGLAAVAGRQMSLTIRGVDRTVMFRHHDVAIEATPIIFYNDVDNADWYSVTLRFMEV